MIPQVTQKVIDHDVPQVHDWRAQQLIRPGASHCSGGILRRSPGLALGRRAGGSWLPPLLALRIIR
jgi:hypothetical protein